MINNLNLKTSKIWSHENTFQKKIEQGKYDEIVKLSGEKNISICLSVKAKYLGFSPILKRHWQAFLPIQGSSQLNWISDMAEK